MGITLFRCIPVHACCHRSTHASAAHVCFRSPTGRETRCAVNINNKRAKSLSSDTIKKTWRHSQHSSYCVRVNFTYCAQGLHQMQARFWADFSTQLVRLCYWLALLMRYCISTGTFALQVMGWAGFWYMTHRLSFAVRLTVWGSHMPDVTSQRNEINRLSSTTTVGCRKVLYCTVPKIELKLRSDNCPTRHDVINILLILPNWKNE